MTTIPIVVNALECFKPLFVRKREIINPKSVSQYVIRTSEEDKKKLIALAPNRNAVAFKGVFIDASSEVPVA
jgi:hypothetical protein